MHATPSQVVLLPMLANLAGVFLCRMFYVLRGGVTIRSRHQRIFRCSVCDHVYVDSRHVPLSRCPRCECLNEPVRS